MLSVCAKSIYASFCLTSSSISNVVYYKMKGLKRTKAFATATAAAVKVKKTKQK